jgi:hypothetical protein
VGDGIIVGVTVGSGLGVSVGVAVGSGLGVAAAVDVLVIVGVGVGVLLGTGVGEGVVVGCTWATDIAVGSIAVGDGAGAFPPQAASRTRTDRVTKEDHNLSILIYKPRSKIGET